MHARMFRCILPLFPHFWQCACSCGCCRIDGFGGTCICVPGHGVGYVPAVGAVFCLGAAFAVVAFALWWLVLM